MDGVGTPIIGRPRPLPGHDTPNPANNTYTLNYEEPRNFSMAYYPRTHSRRASSTTSDALSYPS